MRSCWFKVRLAPLWRKLDGMEGCWRCGVIGPMVCRNGGKYHNGAHQAERVQYSGRLRGAGYENE